MNLDIILTVIAALLLLLAAFQVPVQRVNLGWLGLFCWVLTAVV